MTEEMMFSQMRLYRSNTVKWIEAVDSKIMDVMPANFNNTIHWHIGHILLVQDRLTLRLMGDGIGFPEMYTEWFGNGTKPADWQTEPPSVEFLLQELKEQTDRLQKLIAGKLADKLTLPFLEIETVGEALNYSFCHESMHLGYLMALKRAIEAKSQ
ncbi:MAG: DinB family protein [Paenibacillaceae bacterium]